MALHPQFPVSPCVVLEPDVAAPAVSSRQSTELTT